MFIGRLSMIMRLLFLIALLCFNIVGYAQYLKCEVLDNSNGLPTNAIRRIHQDKEGYMWFASPNGLIRYDGYDYTMFRNDISHPELLYSNNILSIDDSSDYVWIGTESGLNRYDKRSKKIEKISLEIGYPLVNVVFVDNDSCLWLGTSKGLLRYNPKSGTQQNYWKVNDGQTELSGVQDIFKDSQGRLWIALWSNGLVRFDYASGKFYAYPRINPRNSAMTVFEDRQGNLWIGSWGYGLFMLEEHGSIAKTTYRNYVAGGKVGNIGSNFIYSIVQDTHDGRLWIGHRKGLSVFDGNVFENYTATSGVSGINDLVDLNSICIDRTGILWFGLLNFGLRKVALDRYPLESNKLGEIQALTGSSYITAMFEVTPNTFWLGIKNYGLWIYDWRTNKYKSITAYLTNEALSNDAFILDIQKIDHLNEVWVTVRNRGVFCITIDRNGFPVFCKQLNSVGEFRTKIQKVHEDKKHNIWLLSTVGVGVLMYNGEWLSCSNIKDLNIGSFAAQCCAEDREGNMWIGTRNHGLFKFVLNGNKFDIWPYTIDNDGINNSTIMAILVDSQRRVWAATHGGGLNLYSQEENMFKQINTDYNISYDMIFNIFEDCDGNIWFNSENALVRLNPEKHSVLELNVVDQFWDNMFSPTCPVVKLSDTKFILGGSVGYNILNTSLPLSQQTLYAPVITNVMISGKSVFDAFGDRFDGQKFVFENDENDLAFMFSSLMYDNPNRYRFEYRLKGYDKEWQANYKGQHMVNYTNIPPGKYEFQLRILSANDAEESKMASFAFTILPSVFNRWYSWCLYILVFLSICFVSVRIVLGRIRLKRQVLLAEEQKKNAEELAQTKLRFFTNISHELLTPLAVLECAVDNVKQMGVTADILQTMQNNIFYLTRLLRQILEFRKMENDKLRLKIQYGNLSEIVRGLCQNLLPLFDKKEITLSLNLPDDDIQGWFDVDKLDKIVYNLLSNAYKYNKKGGSVSVDLSMSKDEDKGCMALLVVSDTGIGIAKEQLSKIFNRFYDGEYRKQNVSGTGIGLSLVKSLVELHGGTIGVTSKLHEGTSFTIKLPIDFSNKDSLNLLIHSNEDMKAEPIVSTAEGFDAEKLYGKGCSILLVEDNTDLRSVVARLLSRYYRVLTAENGKEALEILHCETVDLVLSDVMMPEMDGFELCRSIKSDIVISHIPVILLTAKIMEGDRVTGYDVGAASYITKPFSPSLLFSRVSSIFKNREILRQHYLQHEPTAVDMSGFTSIDEDFLKKVKAMVVDNLADGDFDLEQFAVEMGMSKSTLYRKVKDITGLTPMEFVRSIRLKCSCEMLKEKQTNISDVAYAVGFSDPKYFSKCFKKEYGMTPNDFIKSFNKESSKE